MRAGVERDALVVGMTLVPGFVSRNRSFALFEDPEVRRARTRSSELRGIVSQLAGALGHVEDLGGRVDPLDSGRVHRLHPSKTTP